jgi:hypothetical protein
MKVTIEIWQSKFNSKWHCDITTKTTSQDDTEHWSAENFYALLNLLCEKFPNAKCIIQKDIQCDHDFEPIFGSYCHVTRTYKAKCTKCKYVPD